MKRSAGLLPFRMKEKTVEYFLVHPGGPWWEKKDIGAWSIPKGEVEEHENHLKAAVREMKEETGFSISDREVRFIPLKEIRQNPGKKVSAWAVETDLDASRISSNTFEMEWPPKSGNRRLFPEIDKAGWFPFAEARKKIVAGQAALLEELQQLLATKGIKP